MSVRVMNLVWTSARYKDASTMLLLLALADWANDEGVCFPSIPKLAEKARMSDRNARYILRKLENDGVISIEENRGRNHSNRYYINLQSLQVSPEENLQPSAQNLQPSVVKPAIAIAAEPSVTTKEPSGGTEGTKQPSRPAKTTTLPKDPLLLNVAVVVYRDLCRLTPNREQRKLIAGCVTDNNLWFKVCEQFMAEGRPPQRVDWLLERYVKARGQPALETKEEKQERLRRQYEERAKNGRDTARPTS
jgi:predicted transcriptional regulator